MEEATNTRAKIDVPMFSGKPPRIKDQIMISEKDSISVLSSSSSSSAQVGLRSLEEFEKESLEIIGESSSSPRDIIEESLRRADSETTSSSNSSNVQYHTNQRNNSSSLWRSFFQLWRGRSMRRLSSFPPFGVSRISRWKSTGRENHSQGLKKGDFDNEFCFFKPRWKIFTALEIQNATNNFSIDNLIGKGGFAEVYKGRLEDGQLVAVKRLIKGTIDERTIDFLGELGILVHLNHPNIAKLIGVSVEDDLLIILRLSPHGSLSALLHGSKRKLEWELRYKIALRTGEGLEYLHERCQRRIIHRDIKSANILLTEDCEPQLCDFGLAKWLPDQLTHHTVSSFEGTFGYLAPEYLTHGVVDEKTDVFAFGVLLLELISGRKALDPPQQSLLIWARPLIEKNDIKQLVDPALDDCYDHKQLKQMIRAASLCTQQSSVLRPRISEVLTLLRGGKGELDGARSHTMPSRRRTYSEELFDAEEYNATRYLNDLNRHKQIALDF